MPNVMGVLRAEIRRLARKETRQEIATLRKQVNLTRRLLAQTRRRIGDLETRSKIAGRRAVGALVTSGIASGRQIRFSPAWVKQHRGKLGMSRRVYSKLLGVSAQTILGWESGRTRPRRAALQAWRSLRERGARELKAMVIVSRVRRPRRRVKGRRRDKRR